MQGNHIIVYELFVLDNAKYSKLYKDKYILSTR